MNTITYFFTSIEKFLIVFEHILQIDNKNTMQNIFLQHIQQVNLTLNIFRLLLDITAIPSLVQQVYEQSLRLYIHYVLHIDA